MGNSQLYWELCSQQRIGKSGWRSLAGGEGLGREAVVEEMGSCEPEHCPVDDRVHRLLRDMQESRRKDSPQLVSLWSLCQAARRSDPLITVEGVGPET